MHLLVTGGAGFIGAAFIQYWLGRNATGRVTNLDVMTYAADPLAVRDAELTYAGRYLHVALDITNVAGVNEVVSGDRPDAIVHFAAESHNSRAVLDPAAFVRTNVLGTQVMLEAAREFRVARFHHISTCEVYGEMELDADSPFREDSPYRPRTPYNASKAAADMLVRAYQKTYGLAATISACSNNYGPRQHPEKVIPLFTTHALDDLPLPLYRHSENRREWLHVEDHCRAIELVLLRGRIGETYNVGSGVERSLDELADDVLRAVGKPTSLKRYVPDRPGHDRRYLLDHTKISSELGWSPQIAFAEGLAKTVDWYRTNRDWWMAKKQLANVDEAAWTAPNRT